jgi:hypothetical protein
MATDLRKYLCRCILWYGAICGSLYVALMSSMKKVIPAAACASPSARTLRRPVLFFKMQLSRPQLCFFKFFRKSLPGHLTCGLHPIMAWPFTVVHSLTLSGPLHTLFNHRTKCDIYRFNGLLIITNSGEDQIQFFTQPC